MTRIDEKINKHLNERKFGGTTTYLGKKKIQGKIPPGRQVGLQLLLVVDAKFEEEIMKMIDKYSSKLRSVKFPKVSYIEGHVNYIE